MARGAHDPVHLTQGAAMPASRPAALARVGLHPQVGEVTVEEIAHEWVYHDRAHLAQLTDLTRRLVWPAMGNARRFSDPDS